VGHEDLTIKEHGITKWAYGGVLAGNIIFAAPASANTVLKIDTTNHGDVRVSTFGNIEGNEMNKFRDAVMTGSCIYFVPAEANKVLNINSH